jgi:predicted nucleotidyltransferase
VLEYLQGGHEPAVDDETFLAVLAEAVEIVRGADVPFVVMGGISSATHGRDRWTHDVDFFVRPEDAGRALEALAEAGFETEQTYWDWLFKAFRKDVMVDLIFRSTGGIRLDDEMVERAREYEFHGVAAPMIPPEDLLVIKAVVHDEHMPRHWHDGLGILGHCELDWDYLLRRARSHGARRVLAMLVYAQSNDLIVPNRVVEELFDAIYRS